MNYNLSFINIRISFYIFVWFVHLLEDTFVLCYTNFHTPLTTAGVPRLAPLYVHTRRRALRPARSWRNRSHSHPSWTIVQWSQWTTNRNCLSVWTVSTDIYRYIWLRMWIICLYLCQLYRAHTSSRTRLFWPTVVFPPAHGQTHWQGHTTGHHSHVLWQEQAARRILVQCAQESVTNRSHICNYIQY